MILYGFEIEGFFREGGGIVLPPKDYPTDGFPGLVELRTSSGHPLEEAYTNLLGIYMKYPGTDFSISSFVFPREFRAELRRRHNEKTAWDIQNLYDKAPRLMGNKTIASCQISISNRTSPSYRDKDDKLVPERYGLLDIPKIVRNLDREFRDEIAASGRQPGEYCVKNTVRLEYRSLPNSVLPFNPDDGRQFLRRIKSAVED